jgi:DNA polymerase kappa
MVTIVLNNFKSTSNYAARRFGIRAAMPGFIARELCPDLVIIECNFDKYRIESERVMY